MKSIIKKFIPKRLLDLYIKIYHQVYWGYEDLKKSYLREKAYRKNKKISSLIKNNRQLRKKFKIGMAVLAHERPEYLEACLDSLFRTKLYNYDITFLLQDDGSNDPKVKELINKERDPKYKIVRYFTNKGHNSWAGAFNKAIKKLQTIDNFDIIGSCDSDALFHPEWLDKTMKIALWAKKNHNEDILGPFSSFNSDQWEFHKILGIYKSPFGNYVVKERMGALNYFYFSKDLSNLGFYEEHRDDETLMTEKFKNLKIRYFCTENSYVEHLGKVSILDKWRPFIGGENFTFAVKPVLKGWNLPSYVYKRFRYLRHCTIIIEIKHGGLGDHLFWSHLPKIAKEAGFKKVYISSYSKFRHPDYKKFIWEMNPFVDGFCNEKGYQPSFLDIGPGMNLLDKVMLEIGLDDNKRFHEPELYYKPILIKKLEEKNIYDPNYVTDAGSKINPKKIEEYLLKNKIKIDFQMKLRDQSLPLENINKTIETKTIEEYFNTIASCNRVYCLASGTATLASALGKHATVFYGKNFKKMFLHSKLHEYVLIDN